MTRAPKQHGQEWTRHKAKSLRQLAKENTPARVIGLKLDRSVDSIYSKVSAKAFRSSSRTNRLTAAEHRLPST